jgi:protein-tyrosine phosphatase
LQSQPTSPNAPLMYPDPVEILPKLYLGNADSSHQRLLQKHNIKAIVRLANGPFIDENKYDLLRIFLEDHVQEPISDFFGDAIAFINEHRHQRHNVLVHCTAGVSRSATIVIAYVAHTMGWPVWRALDYVRQKAPWINPNIGFLRQLYQCEEFLHQNFI